MIDLSIFIDFYFTKYLFMAGAIYGVIKGIKRLMIGRDN